MTARALVKITMAGALVFSLIYLVAGFNVTMLPVGDSLLNQAGRMIGLDFAAFYTAGLMTADGNFTGVYDFDAFNAVSRGLEPRAFANSFAYPPVFLFIVAPLGVLPFVVALVVWSAAQIGLVVWILYRVAPRFPAPLFVGLSPALVHNFLVGQNGALSAAILGGGLILLRAHPVWAGAVFALVFFKPQLALIIPVCLLAGGHYRALGAMAVAGLVLLAASLAVFGFETWQAYFSYLPFHASHGGDGQFNLRRMPTVYVTMLRVTDSGTIAGLAQGTAGLLAAAAAAWIWRATKAADARALALAAATILATPYAFEYDLAILIVPLAYIAWRYTRDRPRTIDPPVIAVLWMLPAIAFLIDAGTAPPILALLLGYYVWRVRISAIPEEENGASARI